jgi:hypothetical protein
MVQSIVSPLQLTAAAALLQNQGIRPLPASLLSAINGYNITTLATNLKSAQDWYKAQAFYTESTFDALLSIGSTTCPALGNSIPAGALGTFAYLDREYLTENPPVDGSTFQPSGFTNLIEQVASAYLGNGDASKFAQGFVGVVGYTSLVNQFITSSVNANEYLGPTFTSMDALTTADISSINPVFDLFGTDIARQGNLVDLKNLDNYGTPSALIQQISKQAKIQGQTIPVIQSALIRSGMTADEIKDIVNNNRFSLFNPGGLSQNLWDKTQKKAYAGLTQVKGADLQQVLDILEVTTPNITSLEQLLEPTKTFPLSYPTMQTLSPNGPIFIFAPNGSVNSNISSVVDSYLPTATGCDELGKIIPQSAATANKAIQVALQNVPNIIVATWPEFGEAIQGFTNTAWTPDQEYLPNEIVSVPGTDTPTLYQSQQDVPVGINITDTAYWDPITLGNLVTMDGLDLIQAQTTAVYPSVTDYFATDVAQGSGAYGTITILDVLGVTLDSGDFATKLDSVTAKINALQTAGTLNALNTILSTTLQAQINDAGVLTQIAAANTAINSISSTDKNLLNSYWVPIASAMNLSAKIIQEAGISYFDLPANQKASVYSFVQVLPNYASDDTPGGTWDYLSQIADTSTLGGQAIVGCLREANNRNRLDNTQIRVRPPTEIPVGAVPAGNFVTPAPKSELYDTYPHNINQI